MAVTLGRTWSLFVCVAVLAAICVALWSIGIVNGEDSPPGDAGGGRPGTGDGVALWSGRRLADFDWRLEALGATNVTTKVSVARPGTLTIRALYFGSESSATRGSPGASRLIDGVVVAELLLPVDTAMHIDVFLGLLRRGTRSLVLAVRYASPKEATVHWKLDRPGADGLDQFASWQDGHGVLGLRGVPSGLELPGSEDLVYVASPSNAGEEGETQHVLCAVSWSFGGLGSTLIPEVSMAEGHLVHHGLPTIALTASLGE